MRPYLLAAAGDAFWNTQAATLIKALLATAGVFVVLYVVFKAVGKFASAKPADAFKTLFIGLIVSVFLFRPELLSQIVDLIGSVVETLIGGGTEVVKNGGGKTAGGG